MKTEPEVLSAINVALTNVGLEGYVSKIIGKTIKFGHEHGGGIAILAATVTAVEISINGAVMLYVSCPKFMGRRLEYLTPLSGPWCAVLEKDHPNDPRFFPGQLVLP